MGKRPIEDFNKKIYSPLGQCMYCGILQNLQDEHIVPYGLSGTTVLPKSTCPSCAKITGQFEQKVLRGPMRAVRVFRKLHSRTKYVGVSETHPLEIVRNKKKEIVKLPLSEYPILLYFPLFSPPAFLNPQGYKKGINIIGVDIVSFGPRPEEVQKKLCATQIIITQNYFPTAFARMIAKIAYSFAIAEGNIDLIRGKLFPIEAILGKKDNIGRWVGTITDPSKKHQSLLHRIALHKDYKKKVLIGVVQLFADSQAPNYGVILGQLKKV